MNNNNLHSLIRSLVLKELNATSSMGASTQAGKGEQYATPKAFKKKNKNKH